ncbi:hypothetical protein [Pseudonocardia sp. TRM90224]|uniref:hypothetical protein n=1 Tax=Pseudonocardia sp. TRM90224 TaxID=2812678 RepID=UPI001E3EA8A2|nr:hypothetical protein [Pseudonocardia sp. TRM90224]
MVFVVLGWVLAPLGLLVFAAGGYIIATRRVPGPPWMFGQVEGDDARIVLLTGLQSVAYGAAAMLVSVRLLEDITGIVADLHPFVVFAALVSGLLATWRINAARRSRLNDR